MPKLFPNIVQLDIGYLPSLEDTEMANIGLFISQLSSLKQLELGELEKVLPFLSQILPQLEHILVLTSGNYIWTEEEFVQLVGHLGPDCVRVFLLVGVELNYNKLRQWNNLKPHFFGNVTHFEFAIEEASDNDDHEQIVHFLSEHAPSLKLLRLSSVARSLVLTTSLLADLRTLTNLAELLLWNIRLELSDLEEAAAQNQLPQLSSLSICSLNWVEWSAESSVDRFMRILSSIFPKLVEMQLHFDMDSIPQTTPDEFEQYLDRFPNLRKQAIYIV